MRQEGGGQNREKEPTPFMDGPYEKVNLIITPSSPLHNKSYQNQKFTTKIKHTY